MQIRFREFNKETNNYEQVSYFDVSDYCEMFKMLKFMQETKSVYAIETSNFIFNGSEHSYYVTNVSMLVPEIGSDFIPCIAVDVEECYE